MLTGDEMKIKITFFLIIIIVLSTVTAFAGTLDSALDEIPTDTLEDYLNKNNQYFSDNNIKLRDLIVNAFKGRLDISLKDYFLYEFSNEQGFFKSVLKTGINIIVICMVLTIIKYFSDEFGSQSVSDIVMVFSVLIIFTIILKDVLIIKNLLKSDFMTFKTITEEINAVFMAAMLTFGKLSIMQFFQTSLNYVVGMTTQLIYSLTDIMTIVMIAVILINNMSKLINATLMYKFLKKATLLILSGYMIIIVINFSVQGYIYYKTDHHWTSLGAYLAYKEFAIVNNIAPIEITDLRENRVDGFLGTYFSKSKKINAKEDYILYYDNLNIDVKIDGVKVSGLNNDDKWESSDKYSAFLNGNNGLTVIKNNSIKNNSKILVIKDSYANSFIQFLINNYNEIYVVDLRSYSTGFNNFFKENKFNNVLIMYSLKNLSEDVNLSKLKY